MLFNCNGGTRHTVVEQDHIILPICGRAFDSLSKV